MHVIKIAALTLALTIPNANAEKINLTAMKCSQFLKTDPQRVDLILTWLMGFYGKVENPQAIDLDQLAANRTRFATFCSQQPNFRIITAADGILG